MNGNLFATDSRSRYPSITYCGERAFSQLLTLANTLQPILEAHTDAMMQDELSTETITSEYAAEMRKYNDDKRKYNALPIFLWLFAKHPVQPAWDEQTQEAVLAQSTFARDVDQFKQLIEALHRSANTQELFAFEDYTSLVQRSLDYLRTTNQLHLLRTSSVTESSSQQ